MEKTGKSVRRQYRQVHIAGGEAAWAAVNVVSLRLARYVASVNLLRRRLRDLFASRAWCAGRAEP